MLQGRNAVMLLQHAIGHPGLVSPLRPTTIWAAGVVGGSTMRVLVVEDHAKLAMALATGLRQAGMAVDVVFDGHDALEHLRGHCLRCRGAGPGYPRRARRRRV